MQFAAGSFNRFAHKHASQNSIKANKLNSTALASSAEDDRMMTYHA
jgi:hypothetical protein